jgi:hypothetical protein
VFTCWSVFVATGYINLYSNVKLPALSLPNRTICKRHFFDNKVCPGQRHTDQFSGALLILFVERRRGATSWERPKQTDLRGRR